MLIKISLKIMSMHVRFSENQSPRRKQEKNGSKEEI